MDGQKYQACGLVRRRANEKRTARASLKFDRNDYKSRGAYAYYYLCPTKGCVSYRKPIPRDKLEGEFEELLQRLEPSVNLFQLARAMFKRAGDMRLAHLTGTAKSLKGEVTRIEKQIEQLLDRIVDASTPSVVRAYEQRISKLEQEKILTQERMVNAGPPRHTLEESFEHALAFLSSPWNIWNNSGFAWKRTVLRLAFEGPFPTAGIRDFEHQKSLYLSRY